MSQMDSSPRPLDRAGVQVLAATRRPIRDKAAFVLAAVGGRKTLDVGCINHGADVALRLGERWLHRRIVGAASSVVGLDLLAEDAARLRAEGYDIRTGNAEDFQLDERFEVIVAADIIEHLANPGSFLDCARRHLTPNGSLVITTPNPFAVQQFAQVLVNGRPVVNDEHVSWLDPSVLSELLRRHGLAVTDLSWIDSDPDARPTSWKVKALNAVARPLGRLRPTVRANYGVIAVPTAANDSTQR